MSGADVGAFGQKYNQRAATALGGLAALPRAEAMYFPQEVLMAWTGFDGAKGWRLTFSKDELPPVDSFWSLSLYRLTAEGQSHFVQNPIDRYAIGDRTRDSPWDRDGSLTIWMTHSNPGGEANRNWLPTPANEKFALSLQPFLPRAEMLQGWYQVPSLVEV
jgi:hypothetical protein